MKEEDPSYEEAKKRALRFLASRPRSVFEVRSKLETLGFGVSTVSKVIERFGELRYLDDESAARQWAVSYALNRLWGDRKIAVRLKERGIAKETIERALGEARREIGEKEAIEKIIEKRFPDWLTSHKISVREKQRLFRHLMGKGFASGVIFEIMASSGKEEYIDHG